MLLCRAESGIPIGRGRPGFAACVYAELEQSCDDFRFGVNGTEKLVTSVVVAKRMQDRRPAALRQQIPHHGGRCLYWFGRYVGHNVARGAASAPVVDPNNVVCFSRRAPATLGARPLLGIREGRGIWTRDGFRRSSAFSCCFLHRRTAAKPRPGEAARRTR